LTKKLEETIGALQNREPETAFWSGVCHQME